MIQGSLKYEITKEKYPWLDGTLPAGKVVYRYGGCTYGCISEQGVAVSDDGGIPFYEIPKDAVLWES